MPTTPRSSASWKRWANSPEIAWKHDVQTMIEGPGHVPMQLIKENMDKQLEVLRRGAVLHPGAAHHRHRPGLRPHHLGHRRRDDRLVRLRDALLRDAEGALGLAGQGGCARRHHHLQARRPRRGPWPRAIPGAQIRDNALSKARFEFRWEDQFNLGLDPDLAREFHDETLPKDSAKVAHFCSMCGPKFCSMKISQEVRDAAGVTAETVRMIDVEAEMEQKAKEFREQGSEIYQ